MNNKDYIRLINEARTGFDNRYSHGCEEINLSFSSRSNATNTLTFNNNTTSSFLTTTPLYYQSNTMHMGFGLEAVGCYVISDGALTISATKKPSRFKRFFLKHLLGIEWKDKVR